MTKLEERREEILELAQKHRLQIGSVRPNLKGETTLYPRLNVTDVYRNHNGWIDAECFIPESFDLVELYTAKKKIVKGWWDGSGWDGLKLKGNERITHWR